MTPEELLKNLKKWYEQLPIPILFKVNIKSTQDKIKITITGIEEANDALYIILKSIYYINAFEGYFIEKMEGDIDPIIITIGKSE